MSFELKPLPYPENALAPAVGERTVSIHYHKHHGGYVNKLNDACRKRELKSKNLEDLIAERPDQKVYNLAAQIWNHDFYWASLTPEQTRPGKVLAARIDSDFGSRQQFEERFKAAALAQFGSGWCWLSWDEAAGKLEVQTTTDAEIPAFEEYQPILVVDVWEHAYYLDYQNERDRYVETVLSDLLDWEAAGRRLADALPATSDRKIA